MLSLLPLTLPLSLPSLTFCRHALTQYYSCHMPLLCFVATNLPCLAYLVNYLGLLALDYFLSLPLFSLLHFLLLLLLHLLLLVGFWCCKVSNFSRLSSDWFGTIMFTYLNAACGMLSHSRRKSTWIFLADSPWQISQSWLALCLCVCVRWVSVPACLSVCLSSCLVHSASVCLSGWFICSVAISTIKLNVFALHKHRA